MQKKHINTLFCSNFSSEDLTVGKLEQNGGSGMYISSVYMAHDKDAPPTEFKDFINSIGPSNLVAGCDVNARHSIWGSSEINERGELLFDFICSSNLELCNRGSTTFIFPSSDRSVGWEEVLDITMVNSNDIMKVCNWRVSVNDSYSDHRYILFNINFDIPKTSLFKNPRRTNWSIFRGVVGKKLTHSVKRNNSSIEEVEAEVNLFERTMNLAFKIACPYIHNKKSYPP